MKRNGAQIVLEALLEQGVDTVFGYPGGQVVNLYDALYEYRGRIRHILTAHEQGAAHAADGYARATGRVGVVIATSGPGATNLVTGIATAMLDSVPMVAITGNVPRAQIGRDSFQEVDITGVTLPITKHNYFIRDISELAGSIREAFRIARSGRPGPVLVDIPKDIQTAECDFEPLPVEPPFPSRPPEQAKLDAAAAEIARCSKPYLYIGGGVIRSETWELVSRLADRMDGVIGCSLMGLGAVPTDNPRFLGMQGMHGHYASSMAEKKADLILAVGVRFSDRATGNTERFVRRMRDAVIVHLDVDFAEIDKNVPAAIGIPGDLRASLTGLLERLPQQSHPAWRAEVGELLAAEAQHPAESAAMTPRALICAINRCVRDDTVIVTDVGQHQMWAAQYCNLKKPRTFLSSGGLGTMGFGMGAAIGACVATGRHTVLITGDGSFGMNLNELATAVSCGLPLTVVIVDNGVLGMVRQWQTLFFGKRYSATTLGRKTDFVKLADAFDAKGVRAGNPAEFETVFRAAFRTESPVVIDCALSPDELVLPMLPPGGTIDDIISEEGAAKRE